MENASLKVYKTVLPYIAKYRGSYLGGFVCLLAVDAAQVLIPQIMRRAIDLVSLGTFAWSAVLQLALAMVGVSALISLGRFLWRFFIHGASRRIEAELRDRLFDHLMTLSYDFYQKNKIGDLMARATNDLNAVRMAIGWGLVSLVDGTVMALAIVVIIFLQDFRTAAFAVLPLPLITILILLFGTVVGKLFLHVQEAYSKMSDTVQETFAGIRVVKSFVKEKWFIGKFADTNDDYRSANMDLVKIFGVFFPLISFLSGLTTVILILVGGTRVVEGLMSPGDLVALFSYLQMLIWPLMGAGFMVNMIQRGAVSLARINEVLESKPSIASPALPAPVPPVLSVGRPVVEIRHLNFSYLDGKPVLEDINLTIAAGAVVGILGRTGSGKSTLIKTLMRMVDPPPGSVLVKGVPVADWDLAELRRHFGVTPQDSYLFSDSIKNNIGYSLDVREEGPSTGRVAAGDVPAGTDGAAAGNANAFAGVGEKLLLKAAELSAIDQDLGSFSDGWDTLIGERGLTLSGGQKQRVAISRAVAGSPEILVLDDSLSAVDAETEKRVLTRLLNERRAQGGSSTIIIISHRVSTLQNADTVIVLDKGRVTESGSPAELIERGGFYAQMAALQRLEQNETVPGATSGGGHV
ncbi:multidrug ABC transporter permease/ATP-binding protein [Spirochaetia bacterium]|nr:multidrug ABC transporter permease/ATP-binding protein [Spirochaetia bacterium]